IDSTGHDHKPGGIECSYGPRGWITRRLDDSAVFDPEILDLAINAVGRVINVAAGDKEVVGHGGKSSGFGVQPGEFKVQRWKGNSIMCGSGQLDKAVMHCARRRQIFAASWARILHMRFTATDLVSFV